MNRIDPEIARLDERERAWWSKHKIEPSIVTRHGVPNYAVAMTGGSPLLFSDADDRFCSYAEEAWDRNLTCYRDLSEAIRRLSASELLRQLLRELVSDFLKNGLLEFDNEHSLKRSILEILTAIGPESAAAVPKLIEIANTENFSAELPERAMAAISAIGPLAAPVIPTLIAMAENDTANSRAWCIIAFAKMGPIATPAVPLLIDLLLCRVHVDPDPIFSALAAEALGNIGAHEALPHLLQVLRETDDHIIANAVIEALGKFGSLAMEARPIIEKFAIGNYRTELFSEYQESLREAALTALDRIDGWLM